MRLQNKPLGAAIAVAAVVAALAHSRASADDSRVTVRPAIQRVSDSGSSGGNVQLVQWGRPYIYGYRKEAITDRLTVLAITPRIMGIPFRSMAGMDTRIQRMAMVTAIRRTDILILPMATVTRRTVALAFAPERSGRRDGCCLIAATVDFSSRSIATA